MAVIDECSKCQNPCILGKDAVVDQDMKVICDVCSGVRRCGRCNTVVEATGRCSYCCEVVTEAGLPYWMSKYYKD